MRERERERKRERERERERMDIHYTIEGWMNELRNKLGNGLPFFLVYLQQNEHACPTIV